MAEQSALHEQTSSLSSLPPGIGHSLIVLSAIAGLSLVTTLGLSSLLASILIKRHFAGQRANQVMILLFNLLLANLQQSMAFVLSVVWVRRNRVDTGTAVCFAQGWFISTGELASVAWCLAIAVHAFASAAYDHELSRPSFYFAIGCLWTFVYVCAIVGIAIHPEDVYVGPGPWVRVLLSSDCYTGFCVHTSCGL